MGQNALLDMLVEDLDSVFLKQFHSRIETVWNEAIARSIKDPSIDPSVKRYCFGHDKYFLTQSMFLKLGAECGYESRAVPCEQNNYPIPVVTVKRFRFTAHHTFKPDEKYAPNPSRTRKQDSTINNEYLKRGQGNLFGPAFDESKLDEADGIQANILFGCGGNGLEFKTNGFLRIAFPSFETEYENGRDTRKVLLVENFRLLDVLALVNSKERTKQARPVVSVAAPKLKVT